MMTSYEREELRKREVAAQERLADIEARKERKAAKAEWKARYNSAGSFKKFFMNLWRAIKFFVALYIVMFIVFVVFKDALPFPEDSSLKSIESILQINEKIVLSVTKGIVSIFK